ncbi:hypothetical protein OO007_13275 [Cocleimonas sp. KMM 6892]|uniref:hypothetical protein n=1 Tax=unclassified Cocleimonas TaxID=2639732 RepID=UPI002DBE43B7|nr:MULTISPECIES: hypothetical protein [unclassified Cocleimonas]MEB8433204.1 hypothetical protein [Cocleimonas sp. KMM 6892]MEC4715815.1 hypothetical protein [Cocleimonas sp. KMM 6895]MEC4745276.1 hypothetical protein [Cocleimonas sp. KMM 6896]
MENIHILTNDRLRALVVETEKTLDELKLELDRREQVQQEHEVAHLENHMKSAELSLKTIRDFLSFLSQDFKNKK